MSRIVDREARRTEIVTAAAAVFAQRGLAATTVSDIVKSAGVAQGTFYLYFHSKDEAVLAVAEHFGDVMIESIERAVAAPQLSAVQKLLSLRDTLSHATVTEGTPELIEIMHSPGNRAIHDRLAEHLTPRLVTIVQGIVDQGMAEGVFDVPDAHAAAWFVLGGLQSAELSGVPVAEMPEALAKATELAFRALGYQGRRP